MITNEHAGVPVFTSTCMCEASFKLLASDKTLALTECLLISHQIGALSFASFAQTIVLTAIEKVARKDKRAKT